jgi:hypothetical protein
MAKTDRGGVTVKARLFVVLTATILATPVYASAQDVAGAVTYEKAGNFVYARQTFLVDRCPFGCHNEYVIITVSCPAGYVALGGGYRSTEDASMGRRFHNAPFNLWADEPTKDHAGWLLGLNRINGNSQQIGMVVTCGLASQ